MTKLNIEPYTLPGARLGDENPLPFFRDPAVSHPVKTVEPFPPEKCELLGWETAFRVLPYRMQDQYTRQREPVTFRAAVLENEYLRATFLPEVGGRLVSLVYKPLDRELLHRNPVFQPANLAIRNAWFSGGIEWNIGQFGHTFTTCSPLFAAAIQGPRGEPGLRLYEFERCKRLFWHIDFYLPPGLPFLVAYTRVINPNDTPTSMYWWTNTAVNEGTDVRVLAPANTALYGVFEKDGPAFGVAQMPGLPSLSGTDGTYSLNSTFANEFFFQCDQTTMPWEAALDGRGQGFIEASTARLKYRKLFVWGSHAGGRHWQEFLAEPGQAYLEIQAGLAPTQVHGLEMPARETWDWTQVFGYIEADPLKVHGADWPAAWGTVEAALKEKLSPAQLAELEAGCRARADQPGGEMLQSGSGWGALELRRRAAQPDLAPVPAAFAFPTESLSTEQRKWLALLERGVLPEQDPATLPGEWMVQPEWHAMLEKSVAGVGRNWLALLHLGVMRLEAAVIAENETAAAAAAEAAAASAVAAWEESIRLKPSVWAYRNLAILRLRQKDEAGAIACYEQAWKLAVAGAVIPSAVAVEYLQILVAAREFAKGMQVYESLPPQARDADRVQILRGQIALELGDLQAVEQVLQREYAVIREGETMLTDLWFEVQARRQAAETGQPLSQELCQRVRAELRPPARIDYRSFDERKQK
jgi:hypothetical protein